MGRIVGSWGPLRDFHIVLFQCDTNTSGAILTRLHDCLTSLAPFRYFLLLLNSNVLCCVYLSPPSQYYSLRLVVPAECAK